MRHAQMWPMLEVRTVQALRGGHIWHTSVSGTLKWVSTHSWCYLTEQQQKLKNDYSLQITHAIVSGCRWYHRMHGDAHRCIETSDCQHCAKGLWRGDQGEWGWSKYRSKSWERLHQPFCKVVWPMEECHLSTLCFEFTCNMQWCCESVDTWEQHQRGRKKGRSGKEGLSKCYLILQSFQES